jgi:hypothetical protein
MNPAPSNCSSFFKTLGFKSMSINRILNTEEGAAMNPAPSNCSTIKVIGFNELNKEEGAG